MAKKLQLKQLFLQRGEMIGLGVAGLVGAALLVTSLFMPKRGLFSPGAAEKVKALKTPAELADRRLRDPQNKPSKPDEIAPSPKEATARLVKPDLTALVSAEFRANPLGHDIGGQGLVRGMPKVYNIEEAVADSAAIPLQSYILEVVRGQLMVSVLAPEEGASAPAMGEGGKGAVDRFKGMYGGSKQKGGPSGPGAGMMGPGMMGPGGAGGMVGQMPGGSGDTKRKARKIIQRTVEQLKQGDTLAEQVLPRRMALIAASFPYKKQVEEFQRALRKADANDVLAENGAVAGPDKTALPSFRFLEVQVQRRELDSDGKAGKWEDLDLGKTYRPLVVHTGKRVEEDDPKFEPVKFPGLVMPKLMQFRPENVGKGVTGTGYGGVPRYGMMMGPGAGGATGEEPTAPKGKGKDKDKADDKPLDRYPPVEDQLVTLKETLKKLEGKAPADVAKPNTTFSGEEFDLFSTRTRTAGGTDEGPGAGGEDAVSGGNRTGGMGEDQPDFNKPRELPEYCLVRVIDVTVEPGKTYEYRLRVVMANPNLKRKDVASAEYARADKLYSGPTGQPDEKSWSEVPIKVQVQEDLRYYAVDQKKMESKYDGINKWLQVNENSQVVLQAHRYLQTVSLNNRVEVPAGEWAVAERFAVYRGEYVGRTERVEVPIWKFDIEDFVVAADSSTSKRSPGIAVPFGFNARGDQPEAILVDFDTGRHNYERVVRKGDDEEKVETRKVTDQAHVEVLMMHPDGRLLLREGAIDCNEHDQGEGSRRAKAVEEARKRVQGLKKDKKKDKIDRGTNPGGTGS